MKSGFGFVGNPNQNFSSLSILKKDCKQHKNSARDFLQFHFFMPAGFR